MHNSVCKFAINEGPNCDYIVNFKTFAREDRDILLYSFVLYLIE